MNRDQVYLMPMPLTLGGPIVDHEACRSYKCSCKHFLHVFYTSVGVRTALIMDGGGAETARFVVDPKMSIDDIYKEGLKFLSPKHRVLGLEDVPVFNA